MITFAAFHMDIGKNDLAGIHMLPYWRQHLSQKSGDQQ
jgi:hypothetical protein